MTDERKAFETWAAHGWPHTWVDEDGVRHFRESSWAVWQARAALSAPQPQDPQT